MSVVRADGAGGIGAWTILGQVYTGLAWTPGCFVFQTEVAPGQMVPVHRHLAEDEFFRIDAGALRVKLDGVWSEVGPGDLVHTPRGVAHGYFNAGDVPARATFWLTPAGRLREMFAAQDGMIEVDRVEGGSTAWGIEFLPAEANE